MLFRSARLGSGDIRMSGVHSVPALAAGASSTATTGLVIPKSAPVGVYRVLACADDLQVQSELNELNNCIATRTTITVT